MANTLTNVNTVKVYSECLSALKLMLEPLNIFSVQYDSTPGAIGETVRVPVISAQSASTGVTDYESGDGSAVSVAVSITTNYARSNHLTAVQASQTQTDAFKKWMMEGMFSIASGILTGTQNLITTAFTNSKTVGAATAMDADMLLDIRKDCVTTMKFRSIEPINVVLDAAYYGNLLKDPAIRDRSASGVDAGVSGAVARWAGMNIRESVTLSGADPYAAPGTGAYLRGFACVPSAIGITVRPPKILDDRPWLSIENVVDPETGIGFQVRTWVAPKTNTLWGCVETLFGGARVNTAALYRFVSQ
jgi:hypothetical protein